MDTSKKKIKTKDKRDGTSKIGIAWNVIILCFLSPLMLTAFLLFKNDFSVESLKNVWEIFIPIIILALRYIFGKK